MTSRIEVPLGAPGPRAAIVVLLLVVASTLSAVVIFRPRERPPTAAPVVRVSGEPPLVAGPPTALALIDAIPWGRIERIETSSGDPHPLPDSRETPVLLELPAGDWRVVLSNPRFSEERICTLSLADTARQDCLAEFERLSVDQYFREAGWWR